MSIINNITMDFRKTFLLFSLPFLFSGIFAQNKAINQNDSAGRKTGIWETYYESGRVKSHGTFNVGHPVGELTKYYPGGIVQAVMNFDETGRISYVKMFYETGNLASEGKYIDQKKDSVWNYFSTYDKRKAVSETYQMGKKHGLSYKYYVGGSPSEMHEWQNNLKNGKWEQYYENDQVRIAGGFVADSLNGAFVSYNPDGSLSITGSYQMGAMHGTWTYYSETGEEEFSVEYIDGRMLPNAEMDKRIEEFSKKVKDIIGDIDEIENPENF